MGGKVPAEEKYLFLQDGDYAVGRGDCQSCVGSSNEGAAGPRGVDIAVYCDADC